MKKSSGTALKKQVNDKVEQKKDQERKKHPARVISDYLQKKYDPRFNEMTHELEILFQGRRTSLEDRILFKIVFDLDMEGYTYKKRDVSANLVIQLIHALASQSYHPLHDYFEQLEWDGKDHIQALADTVTISDLEKNGVYLRDLWLPFLKKWLVAAVAQATRDKASNHTCLILSGGQGKGKTTWLNKLCPRELKEYLVCSHISPSLTDSTTANYLAEKFIINIDDQLEVIFGKDYNSMKALITAPAVNNRKAYARLAPRRPRTASFVGSVNSPQFLTDTQNRRYLVFEIEDINYQTDVDINQVYAQAKHLLENGFSYWLNQEEIAQLNEINTLFRIQSTEEELLRKYYRPATSTDSKDDVKYLMQTEIMQKLEHNTNIRLRSRRLTDALKMLDFERTAKRINGTPRYCYTCIELDISNEKPDQENPTAQNNRREAALEKSPTARKDHEPKLDQDLDL